MQLVDDAATFRHRSVLHEEIYRLPGTYQTVVILCVLEGLSPRSAAAQLGWPVRRVERLLVVARAHLRARLAHRGIPLAAPRGITELLRVGDSAVSPRLIESTVRIATRSRQLDTGSRMEIQ